MAGGLDGLGELGVALASSADHLVLDLCERLDLDLANPLPGDAVALAELVECQRFFPETPLGQDIPAPGR